MFYLIVHKVTSGRFESLPDLCTECSVYVQASKDGMLKELLCVYIVVVFKFWINNLCNAISMEE